MKSTTRNKFIELERLFNKLKYRIIKHRSKCKYWQELKPCFNCHNDTLTRIENAIEELEDD